MASKVKFDRDVAFKNIIGRNEPLETPEAPAAKKGRKKVDRETKKRISLTVFPSTYADLQKIAFVDRQSASDVITKLIEQYVAENHDKLKEYEALSEK